MSAINNQLRLIRAVSEADFLSAFILIASSLFLTDLPAQNIFISALDEGTTFTALSNVTFRFTITGGASEVCPAATHPDHPEWWGWKTELLIYRNRPVFWSGGANAPDHPNPADWDFSVGDPALKPAFEEAEQAGMGLFVDIPLRQNDYLVFVVNDSKGYFWDNSGGVSLQVTKEPCCDPRGSRYRRVDFPDGPFPQTERIIPPIEADSGERLEVWWVLSPLGHYEFRYYRPGAGHNLTDGLRVGQCHFGMGVNDVVYFAPDTNPQNGKPDCFQATHWTSWDFGADDNNNGLLDMYHYAFAVCRNKLSVSHEQYDYTCGPPLDYPPQCQPWHGALRSQVLFDPFLGPETEALFDGSLAEMSSAGLPQQQLAMHARAGATCGVYRETIYDLANLQAFTNAIGHCVGESNYLFQADVDADGCVTLDDLNLLLTVDTDEDGTLDWQEYIAGTDPYDRESVLRLIGVERPRGGGVVLHWTSVTNRMYSVWRSPTLSMANFTVLANDLASTPPINTFTDMTVTNDACYFYRVGVR